MNSKHLLIIAVSILLFAGTSCKSKENTTSIHFNEIKKFASEQIDYGLSQIEINKSGNKTFPRTFEHEKLVLTSPRDWTSGFFPGNLWYMYELTGENKWKEQAQKFTHLMEPIQFVTSNHDLGFMMYCSYGNGYRLTNDKSYVPILVQSAKSLISRYKPNAKIIRSWDHNRDKWDCPVIIDNMMNLEFLFWATRATGDSTYFNVAVNHANTTMKNHFREDYSTYHVIDYDTITGEVLKRNTHQGYAHESTWARGEAWALYGYTMCYRETKDETYLQQAQHIADFIFSHPNMPADLVPYWDFDDPEIPNVPRDASSASIIASALYELSLYNQEKSAQYVKWADKIISNLTNAYRSPVGENGGFLLLHSTGSKPKNSEVDVPLVYADYYYLEALLRKQNLEK